MLVISDAAMCNSLHNALQTNTDTIIKNHAVRMIEIFTQVLRIIL